MAADTREESSSKSTTSTQTVANTSQNSIPLSPPPNANLLPGGTENTAGGKTKEISFVDALRSVKLTDFQEVHKKPCVRDALLTGIGSGFGLGSARAVWGATAWSSCNWAVTAFVFGSCGMYEFCQRRRLLEKEGMRRAVEVLDRKKAEKKKRIEELKAGKNQT